MGEGSSLFDRLVGLYLGMAASIRAHNFFIALLREIVLAGFDINLLRFTLFCVFS